MLRVVQENQGVFDHLGPQSQSLVGLVELGLGLVSLDLNASQSLLDLGGGQISVCREIDQILLLGVEPHQLGRQLLMEELGSPLLILESVVHQLSDLLCKIAGKALRPVKVDDRCFNSTAFDVPGVALMLMLLLAEEVSVLAPVTGCPLHDHARLNLAIVALAAPQTALQVVVMPVLASPASAAAVQHCLHAVKKVLINKGLVTASDEFTLVSNEADVIGVSKQRVELRR